MAHWSSVCEGITKHGGDIDKASVELCKIIGHCRTNNRKAICFITGVPDGKGTQALAKLASAVARYAEVTKQDVGNGWEPVDSSRWTEALGIAKIYRGEKAYGI